jgi:hypothetical protein
VARRLALEEYQVLHFASRPPACEKATEHGAYTYGYDAIDRLRQAEYPTFSPKAWTYGPLGNRLTDARTGESQWTLKLPLYRDSS